MLITITSNAQTKIKDGSVTGSSSLAKPGAILDLESNNRALLLPRVELTSTTSWAPLNGAAPAEGGYTVYNTSTTTTEGSAAYPVLSGGAGEYYWDGGGWVAKKYNAASGYQEPFQVEGTTTKATTNTQNIYQNGNLGLGDFSTSNPIAKLDVRGAIRGGTDHLGAVGSNSAAFGLGNTASGQYAIATGSGTIASGSRSTAMGLNSTASGSTSIAMGLGTTASGDRSTAIGNGSIASGVESVAVGQFTTASGLLSIATGYSSTASGNFSTAMGIRTVAASNHETVIGSDNAIRTGTNYTGGAAYVPVATDALFQVGNGFATPSITRSNALTVLKNGKTKIGGYHTTKPDLTLEISGTDGVLLPTGTDAERPATAVFGTLRYNTSIGRAEVYVNDVNGDGTQGDAGWRPI